MVSGKANQYSGGLEGELLVDWVHVSVMSSGCALWNGVLEIGKVRDPEM